MPRQRVDADGAARETRSPLERERECDGAEGRDRDPRARRVLPQLVPAKQRLPPRERDGFPFGAKPHWMAPAGGVSTRRTNKQQRQNGAKRHRKADPRALTLLDEQMLVLCRSAMQHSWGAPAALEEPHALPREPLEPAKTTSYGHESIYAAVQVQRLFRGVKTRRRLAQFDGPRFQRAAGLIQFALRRVLVAKRAFKRWMGKRHRCATRIQAWYRGCRVRDQVQYERARVLVERVVMFQRRFRGYRFWNIVAALLAQRRNKAATQVQRCCRGMLDRRRVRKLRQERIRFANELKSTSDEHRRQSRCKGCHWESWTEDTLFGCFMVRFIGLHDFNGAKTLGLEGVQSFPASARFSFMVSILLQAMGEDLEISLAFLRRAETVCRLTDVDVLEVERRYLFPALQLCKNDIAVLVDLAIISQSTSKLTRAESFYRSALEQTPLDYSVPGYLHRVDMLDRLLLNYHRFCSIFNSRQVNVLAKVIPIAKRGEQVRVMVSRLNHFVRIQCAEDETVHRFNAVYLSEKEVHLLLATKDKADDDDDDAGSSRSLHPATTNLVKMNYSRHASARRISRMAREDKSAASKVNENAARKRALTQIYQDEFRGLAFKPTTISRSSEARSKLQVTREQAERLLRELLFIEPYADMKVELSDFDGTTSTGSVASLHRVLLVPSVMRHRMIRVEEVLRSHGALNIQRVFRGFQVHARMRREKLLHTLRQQQVDQLYARLHQNFQFREKRRRAATAIQRIYKGFATRRLMATWRKAATNIQRMLRGYRGRKRAVAFREGNLTFYMAERFFNRGVSVSGKSIMLTIDRCGLSFRLEAYDMVRCTTYPGFITHDSTMALLRYENWSYAQRLVGQEVWLHGFRGVIAAVASINQADGQCTVECRFGNDDHGHRLVALTDCIQAINLRNLATKGLDAEQLLLPLSTENTGRIVSSIVGRLALVPAIPMATKELRKKAPGSLVLTVMAPPKVHYIFNKTGSVAIEFSQTSTKSRANASVSLTRQVAFPVIDGYRGVSIGKRQFRQKCSRHSTHFTKCRCVLPLTTTPAYIQTITLALTPPPPPSYLLTSSPVSQPTPGGPL